MLNRKTLAPLALGLTLLTSPASQAADTAPPRDTLSEPRPAYECEVEVLMSRDDVIQVDWDKLGLKPEQRLYVTYQNGSRIAVIDPESGAIQTIVEPDAKGFEGVIASPVQGRIYASSPKAGKVFAYDIQTLKQVDVVALPKWEDGQAPLPAMLTLDPGEGLLYIGDWKAPVVRVVEAADLNQPVETFLAYYSAGSDAMAFRPGSLDLTLGGFMSHTLGVRAAHLDFQKMMVWFDWHSQEFGMTGGGIQGTLGFDWAGETQRVVVGNAQRDQLLVLDPDTGAAVDWHATAAMPMRLAVDPRRSKADPALVYVPTGQGWTLDVFEVAPKSGALSLVTRLPDVCSIGVAKPVLDSPTEVIFNPGAPVAYLLCNERIQLVDTATHQVVGAIPLSSAGDYVRDMAYAVH